MESQHLQQFDVLLAQSLALQVFNVAFKQEFLVDFGFALFASWFRIVTEQLLLRLQLEKHALILVEHSFQEVLENADLAHQVANVALLVHGVQTHVEVHVISCRSFPTQTFTLADCAQTQTHFKHAHRFVVEVSFILAQHFLHRLLDVVLTALLLRLCLCVRLFQFPQLVLVLVFVVVIVGLGALLVIVGLLVLLLLLFLLLLDLLGEACVEEKHLVDEGGHQQIVAEDHSEGHADQKERIVETSDFDRHVNQVELGARVLHVQNGLLHAVLHQQVGRLVVGLF